MSDTSIAVRWRSLPDDGLEHSVVRIADSGITAEGVVVGGTGADAFGLRYRLTADPGWTAVRSLHVTLLGGATVALRHDGYGEWTDGEGKKRKEFSGVLDVDLGATPIGLVCSLRRQTWKAGRKQEFDVLAIGAPGLGIARESRAVACVEPGRSWRLADKDVVLGEDGLLASWAERYVRIDLGSGAAP